MLRQQLERDLAACTRLPEGRILYFNPRHEQAHYIAETLRYCPHEALFPLVVKLIALPDSNLCLAPLIQHVYAASASPEKAHALFRDYLLGPDPAQATEIFSFWEHSGIQASPSSFCSRIPTAQALAISSVRYVSDPNSLVMDLDSVVSCLKANRLLLPRTEVQRLARARNVWVKALTWVTFPRQGEPRWVEGLMADLRRLNRPFPTAEFNRLLRQLDSPRFAVRERASADLLRVGDAVEPTLRNALKQPLTLELTRRIERLLAEIDQGVPDPLRRETLAHLAARGRPEARAVLETLARGIPQARLTKEAAAALKEMNQRQQAPR